MTLSGDFWRNLILSVGTHRGERPLSPIEVAEGIRAAMREGLSKTEIAAKLHLNDSSMVGKFLSLLRLDPTVRHLVGWGRTDRLVSMSAATDVSRLVNSDQIELISNSLAHGFSKEEVRQIVQIRLRSGHQINECISRVINLRPQVTIRHVFVGEVNEPDVAALFSSLPQAERDRYARESIEMHLALEDSDTVRASTSRFTLVVGAATAKRIGELNPNFESVINIWIKEKTQKC